MAERLIREKGQPVTLVRQVQAFVDPVTLEKVPAADQEGAAYGVFLSPGANRRVRVGTQELQVDWRVLVAGVAAESTFTTPPRPNDRIEDAAGRDWTIMTVDTVAPDGTVILYDVLVRG